MRFLENLSIFYSLSPFVWMSVPGIGLSIASKVLIDDWMSFPDIIQALTSEICQ